MATHVTPVNSEREFKIEETFFSLTDPKGRILAGNGTFTRISGFAEAELIGKPHNIIRHPDTPRAVFKLLWDTINAGKPIAAYVKNMAKNGTYYWVVALVAPVKDGHVSIRFKPTSKLFDAIIPLYAKMREIEEACIARGEGPNQAITASSAHLVEVLGQLGFPSYEALMHHALLRSEIDSRDAILSRTGVSKIPAMPERTPTHPIGCEAALVESCGSGRHELASVDRCYAEIERLLALEEKLKNGIAAACGLAEEFTLTALNISIRAMRFGAKGGGVSVVASNLASTAHLITTAVGAMRDRAKSVSDSIGSAAFAVGWSRLQMETAVAYYHEIYNDFLDGRASAGSDALRARVSMAEAVADAATRSYASTKAALEAMGREVGTMGKDADALRRFVISLQVSKVVGLTEAAHLGDVMEIQASFEDMKHRVERIQEVFSQQETTIEEIIAYARKTPAFNHTLEKAMSLLTRNAQRLQKSCEAEGPRETPVARAPEVPAEAADAMTFEAPAEPEVPAAAQAPAEEMFASA